MAVGCHAQEIARHGFGWNPSGCGPNGAVCSVAQMKPTNNQAIQTAVMERPTVSTQKSNATRVRDSMSVSDRSRPNESANTPHKAMKSHR